MQALICFRVLGLPVKQKALMTAEALNFASPKPVFDLLSLFRVKLSYGTKSAE